jgi:hypothetical protein
MHRSSSALILFSVVKWNTSASAEEVLQKRESKVFDKAKRLSSPVRRKKTFGF